MTDAAWAVIRPSLPTPSWLEGRGGQPGGYCHRQMLDAIRYMVAGGISWRAMPADFPGLGPGLCLLPLLARARAGRGVPRPAAREGAGARGARGGADGGDHRRAVGEGRCDRSRRLTRLRRWPRTGHGRRGRRHPDYRLPPGPRRIAALFGMGAPRRVPPGARGRPGAAPTHPRTSAPPAYRPDGTRWPSCASEHRPAIPALGGAYMGAGGGERAGFC
ncbi:transposase [Streptomyces sp. NPDC059460]|uniref:transposase n=1 Tax=Streptomyces sp. NPDC059460 TaxID=3346840 RepID=UPI003698E97A